MLEKNSVHQGDCLEIMKLIDDKSIDLILADLPYGTTACKWDTIIPFEPLWEQYKRIIKDNGAIVLTASQPFTSSLVMSNPKMFRYSWVWNKSRASNFVFAKKMPLKEHEDILVFGNKIPIWNPQKNIGKPYQKGYFKSEIEILGGKRFYENKNDNGERYPRTIQYFSSDSDGIKRGLHPTQKPVALFEYLIKTYTNEGDVVLDNCAGSGTTAIAAINTNRKYILMEQAQEYIDIIHKRISDLFTDKL